MIFLPAGEILGATTRIRSVTIADHPTLPHGVYGLVDTYCTDPDCDCRKTMVMVVLGQRHVSTINFGWESPAFYERWYGAPLDECTLAEMRGPSIDLSSPNLVPPAAMLAFFTGLLDAAYLDFFRTQYTRFRAGVATPEGAKRVDRWLGGGGPA